MNEHLEDISREDVDVTVNAASGVSEETFSDNVPDNLPVGGAENPGGLDPSVFFGLFDDLDELDGEVDEPTAESDHGSESADEIGVDPEKNGRVDITDTETVEPETVEPETVEPETAGDAATNEADANEATDDVAAGERPTDSHGPLAELLGAESPTTDNAGYGATDDGGWPIHPDSESEPMEQPTVSTGDPLMVIFAPSNANGAKSLPPVPGHEAALESRTEPTERSSDTKRTPATAQTSVAAPPAVDERAAAKKRAEHTHRSPVLPPVQNERAGGTMAAAALLTIAVGLFGGFIVAFIFSLRSPDIAPGVDQATGVVEDGPASTVGEELSLANVAGRLSDGTVSADSLAGLVEAEMQRGLTESRLDLTGITFEPGTTKLTARSQAAVDQLGTMLAGSGATPVTVLLRTYTERTASENLVLSGRQAAALTEALVATGAKPEQVQSVGLGASPLSSAQPVPNFVALTPGFGDHKLSAVIDDEPMFSVGAEVSTETSIRRQGQSLWPLRIEGLEPMVALGRRLNVDDELELGLAGYSFFAPSDEQNHAEAEAAAESAARFLAETFGIDQGRLSLVTPGSQPYVPSADSGNFVWIAAGPDSQPTFDVAGIDTAAIRFIGGSDAVDPQTQPAVDALAAVLTTSGASVVIDVRAFEGSTDRANLDMSEARADLLVAALVAAGAGPEQVRAEPSGASTYFAADGPLVTVTVLP